MILRNWEILCIPEYDGNLREKQKERDNLEVWDPPPNNMFKLNFDGVSNGNPSLIGFGGAIQNSEGKIMGICWGCLSENTNNVAELKGLLAGFVMAIQHSWFPIILEGDSCLILQMVTKLLHGKPVSKVEDNWKMAHTLEKVRGLLRMHSEVQIHHVKRKENKLANLLANYRVRQKR